MRTEVRAATVPGAVISKFTESARGNEVMLKSLGTLPWAVRKQVWLDNWPQHDKIVDTERTGGEGQIDSYTVQQLFWCNTDGSAGKFWGCGGVVKINDMHGERSSITPGSHGDNILDTESKG
jgi:hypothetical protein